MPLLQEANVDCNKVDASGSPCCLISESCSCVQRRFHEHAFPAKDPPRECRPSSKASPALVVALAVVLVALLVGVGLLHWRRWLRRRRAEEEETKVQEEEEAKEGMIDPAVKIES